jgi:hypothetical protein
VADTAAGGRAAAPKIGIKEPFSQRQRQSHAPFDRVPVPLATAPDDPTLALASGEGEDTDIAAARDDL